MTYLSELTENILPFWMDRMAAGDGGFHGRMDGSGKILPQAVRGGILNARILWTFSSAYRILKKPEYIETALKAKRQIFEHFQDKEFGGTFWSVRPDGTPEDSKKQIYSIAFTIYALAELYRATGDSEALELAVSLFHDIEEHSFDPDKNGYLEAFARDWSPLKDMRLSEKDQNDAKTMNTHLHILEGYTGLYRVWKDETLSKQLRNLIELFLNRILMPDGHLALFFDEDWNITSHVISYGHDIECSWLLVEAAQVLGDKALLDRVNEACSKTARAAMEGWSPDGGMVYEKDLSDGTTDGDRHWWVQAETVVGCAWEYLRSGDSEWLARSQKEWKFIRKQIICSDGEWWWARKADGSADTENDRAGFWKCPYHNGRMCMEMLEKRL